VQIALHDDTAHGAAGGYRARNPPDLCDEWWIGVAGPPFVPWREVIAPASAPRFRKILARINGRSYAADS